MLDSLYIAATGMNAQQLNVDTISNNLANVSTTGFKRARVSFEDLVSRQIPRSLRLLGADGAARYGTGVAVGGTSQVFVAGDLKKTEQPYDLAIRGNGFFEVTRTDGSRAYTRDGAFQLDADGTLVTAGGLTLNPALRVPSDATNILIDAAGKVTATLPNEAQPAELGTIELFGFMNPAGLKAEGNNLYSTTERSGDAIPGKAGEQGMGAVAQGFLEASNVRLVDEFVNLIVAQRAYEASSKAIQAADEMLGITNNLRR
ncbi:MAG: flagellar basal-body rod protein FlgG [Rhizobacter sp.]